MRVSQTLLSLFILSSFSWFGSSTFAQTATCLVPLTESQSSPSIDLILNGSSADRDLLEQKILNGFDSSTLEPQLSNLYVGQSLPFVKYPNLPYPAENETVNFVSELGKSSGLISTRIALSNNPNALFQLNFSVDIHPALARNALMRKLGYNIASPKYYSKLTVKFQSLSQRKTFLEHLVSTVGDGPAPRFVVGGDEEIAKENLLMTFQDVVLEPSVVEVPQMHWGILRKDEVVDNIQSRRSIRALLVPLTLLNIPQSANIYSFEAIRIYDDGLYFSRANADVFKNETTIGDVKWIANKISKLTREDWTQIIQAAHYPADIQALLVEKTIGRMNQMMGVIGVKNFKPLDYDPYLSYGNIISGKATKEFYDGFVPRFTYGDPENPLRAPELARFFGIQGINGGLGSLFEKANSYLQLISPSKYIANHNQRTTDLLIDHLQNRPNEPFILPVEVWGGPVASGGATASRNIVTGTYYGSDSQIQLVDTISANANLGFFAGVSGLKSVGLSASPQLQYSRSYVHVRPLSDIKSAWKDRWTNILVPNFMLDLSKALTASDDGAENDKTIENFLSKMKEGEIFIITDGIAGGLATQAQIPLGATLGLISPYSNLSVGGTLADQYAIISRTTITKTQDGFQVYLSRVRSGAFEVELNASFFVKVLSLANTISKGSAHTKAYTFPETFSSAEESTSFITAVRSLLRKNDPSLLESKFDAFQLDHKNNGNKQKFTFGPWRWSKRENFHSLEVTPPVDRKDPSYIPEKMTAVEGRIIKISGSDFFGFFTSIIKRFVPLFNIGSSSVGDDPSTGFLGKSKSFTVSTEIETTPNRPNHTFMKLQQSYAGWSIAKKNFLKIIDQIKKDVGTYNPQGGLINPSEFSQTKKIQAYTILWNMMVYENGINNVLKILDLNTSSTSETQNFLIKLMGKTAYEDYCRSNDLDPVISRGPYLDDYEGSWVESSRGQSTYLGCVVPWMETIYDLRQRLSNHPEVFMPEVRTESDAKEKIRWINRAMIDLSRDLDLEKMISWFGKENAFFQVRVSGFRTRDERALDENFNANYFSSTIGVINQDVFTGPISDIENASKLSSHEIEARYLSDGY